MRINELSDEQKTVMLARLCGWGVSKAMAGTNYESIFIYTQDNQRCTNLYDPANMPLAWRVLNWADDQKFGRHSTDLKVYEWWGGFLHNAPSLAAADAQRAWLDYILRKAIEAGIVEPVKNYPTKWGLKRYPPNGIYTGGFGEQDKDWWLPCTCTQRCETPCKGECGCQACDMAYNDFLSME